MNKKSGHWQNTGLAKWISDNLYQYNTSDEKSMNPMKWHSINNGGNLSDTRETINGFPCRLILINDGETPLNEGQNEPTPGNVKDMGIFNFNNDKGNTDTFGLDNSIFPRCVSYEVVANSDTSAGAFVPFKADVNVFYDTAYSAYFTIMIPNNIFYPNGNSAIISSDVSIEKIDCFDNSFVWQNQFGKNQSGTFEYSEYDYIQIRFGGTAPQTLTLNGVVLKTNIIDKPEYGNELNYVYRENVGELAYLQDSFELRYPDDKEVGADYGFLGMESDCNFIDYVEYGGYIYTSTISTDYFNTNVLTFGSKARISSYTSSNVKVKDNVQINIGDSLEFTEEEACFRLRDFGDTIIINDVIYKKGNSIGTVLYTPKNPYTSRIISSEYGLKRVVDFVGNSTNEEFVANFEQYFNKEYTFRYYLLVIALG